MVSWVCVWFLLQHWASVPELLSQCGWRCHLPVGSQRWTSQDRTHSAAQPLLRIPAGQRGDIQKYVSGMHTEIWMTQMFNSKSFKKVKHKDSIPAHIKAIITLITLIRVWGTQSGNLLIYLSKYCPQISKDIPNAFTFESNNVTTKANHLTSSSIADLVSAVATQLVVGPLQHIPAALQVLEHQRLCTSLEPVRPLKATMSRCFRRLDVHFKLWYWGNNISIRLVSAIKKLRIIVMWKSYN